MSKTDEQKHRLKKEGRQKEGREAMYSEGEMTLNQSITAAATIHLATIKVIKQRLRDL